VAMKRDDFRKRLARVRPSQLIFVDESGAQTNLTRRAGRAPKGERLVDAVPNGHDQVTTMVGAIRLKGLTAGLIFEGATDTEAFATFVEQILVPQLRRGDVVVMDNLSSHKSQRIATALKSVGATLWYLPPYSPDFNPIEKMWSKIKSRIRSRAARTRLTLWNAIGKAWNAVQPHEIQAYFQSCGINAT
jgi:transposase